MVGLPVLIHAPAYAAVTAFFREHEDTVEVVTTNPESAEMQAALSRLEQPARRELLATRLLALGRGKFSPEAAWGVFRDALASASAR